MFTRPNGVWSQQAELVETNVPPDGLQGYSVSLSRDGNTAIVGAPNAGPFGELVNGFPVFEQSPAPGAALVYTRSGGVWIQQGSKLAGTGAVGQSAQGSSASLSEDGSTAIIGGADDNGGAGAAWVFAPFAGTPGAASCFGQSVSMLAREFEDLGEERRQHRFFRAEAASSS